MAIDLYLPCRLSPLSSQRHWPQKRPRRSMAGQLNTLTLANRNEAPGEQW